MSTQSPVIQPEDAQRAAGPLPTPAPAQPAPPPVPVGGAEWVLRHGDQELVIVEVGGGIRRYTAAGLDVLDGYDRGELPPGCRGQVLAPWCNRIRDGRYTFDGNDYQLDISEPATDCALHGLFRWIPFVVEELGDAHAVVSATVYARAGYPFTVVLRTRYALGDAGLTVSHAAHNVGAATAPFSLATHCYLHAGDRVDSQILQVPGATYLPTDDRLLPLAAAAVSGTDYDFRIPRALGPTVLDTAYTDLDRDPDGLVRASVIGPDGHGVQVWADSSFDWLQVYSSDTQHGERFRRSFAIEPMTAPADAFNSGTDLVVLPVGGSWSGTWGVRPLVATTAAVGTLGDAAARAAFLQADLVPGDGADDPVDPSDRADSARGGAADDRLTREVPPHHGG